MYNSRTQNDHCLYGTAWCMSLHGRGVIVCLSRVLGVSDSVAVTSSECLVQPYYLTGTVNSSSFRLVNS